MYKSILVAVVAVLAVGGLAFGGALPSNTNFTYSPANNVYVDYVADTGKMNFTISTKNHAGDRVYSTSNNTTAIWFQQNTAQWRGTTLASTNIAPTVAGLSNYTGWTGL